MISDKNKRIELILKLDESRNQSDLIWADARLTTDGVDLISSGDKGFINWTWVDLLEWLAHSWDSLEKEQTYPLQIEASDFSDFLSKLKDRWKDMDEDQVDEEEMVVYPFIDRHDLAYAFKGMFISSIYFIREGDLMQITICEIGRTIEIPHDIAMKDLEEIGKHLSLIAGNKKPGRGSVAVEKWNKIKSL